VWLSKQKSGGNGQNEGKKNKGKDSTMALSIVRVQDSRLDSGVGLIQESFLLIPGSSDYVTGGYPVTATALGFKLIQSGDVNGQNATAATPTTGWNPYLVFPLAQVGAGGLGFSGYSQFLFQLLVIGTGAQPGSGAPINGALWVVTVQGY
jgi:hypothetical protein